MKACGCCGRKRSNLKRALVFLPQQDPAIRLTCRKCRLGAIPAVSPPPAQVPSLCRCGKEQAHVGLECVAALERQVQELTRANLLLREELKAERVLRAHTALVATTALGETLDRETVPAIRTAFKDYPHTPGCECGHCDKANELAGDP